MSLQQDTDRHARQFHGLVSFLEDLGIATEKLFSRLYNGLSSRNKVRVDSAHLQQYGEQAQALQQRVQRQNTEIVRLTTILASIDEGVIMQGPDGRIMMTNDAARQIIGTVKAFRESEAGQYFRDSLITEQTPPSGNKPQSGVQIIGEPQQFTIQERLIRARLAIVRNPAGTLLGTVIILKDITGEKLADRLKNSFITHMSHELRTPLTAIKGMSDIMLSLPEGTPPPRQFMEAISRNVGILDRMVVELLDISEISEGSLTVRQDDLKLDDIVETVVSGYNEDIRKAGLQIHTMTINSRHLHLKGDSRRLQWALGGILDNAIKYNVPDGKIYVRTGQIRQNQVMIYIEDTGAGIRPTDLPQIFDRYFRGEARDRDGNTIDPRGLGQGLYVAKAVVEAHRGHITVASTLNQGSIFTIALPIS